MKYFKPYDVIIVGAGHAGYEAAFAVSKMGLQTLLLTMNLDTIGQMSCNPSIGGIAKGHVVREMDALGGFMGLNADITGLQFRQLNLSKGEAVQAPRIQCDKKQYQFRVKQNLEQQNNLDIKQDEVVGLDVIPNGSKKKIVGLYTKIGIHFTCQAVILTTGTFLKAILHQGDAQTTGGRQGECSSHSLSQILISLGFKVERFKTGTPMRINAKTIDFSKCEIQNGDTNPFPFSHQTKKITQKQLPCYITYTNDQTKAIIQDNISKSPLYSGRIEAKGPRYCPSIEDKIVKFPHHHRHQIFLEPEGYNTQEIYVNGLSTSFPEDIQLKIIQTIPGMKDSYIMRPGYAVEYDYCDPTQCLHTLETKLVENLYFAGQICGTTGYEEAGGQGLMAGINAGLKIKNQDPFILKRYDAYIGVMIDDLVTKGVDEPYRLFTSRAEYRLSLRYDNADQRLMQYGYHFGLVSQNVYDAFNRYKEYLKSYDGDKFTHHAFDTQFSWDKALVQRNFNINKKYINYLQIQKNNILKQEKMENTHIPDDLDYDTIKGCSLESIQKFKRIKPTTIGQATRVPGVTSADIAVLIVRIKFFIKNKKLKQ